MSLERVIAEQQQKIDQLTLQNKGLIEDSVRLFKKNEDLFEAWARFMDADLPTDKDREEGSKKLETYSTLRNEVRIQMYEAGYCPRCYNFVCECEDQYD